MSHRVDHAATWLIWTGQDVHPLHHAEILMGQHVAVRHEAADRDRVKVDAKSDRADWVRIDINAGGESSWLRLRTRHDHGVVPFWRGQRLAVDLGEQEMVLMDVERMIGKRAIEHRPFLVCARNHVIEQWLVRVKQPSFTKLTSGSFGSLLGTPLSSSSRIISRLRKGAPPQ